LRRDARRLQSLCAARRAHQAIVGAALHITIVADDWWKANESCGRLPSEADGWVTEQCSPENSPAALAPGRSGAEPYVTA
jgi:hypothetical protein